ncbi:MAG: EVE domain-containing protein [Phycisphaerales bacterium]|nr:EVE domain-containing protein [Phycisphaerales bacterium]
MAKQYWLVKSEPFKYSWDDFVQEGQSMWNGVRNYAARNNMRAMSVGDQVLFYHSNEGLCVVGIAEVVTTAYQDPTTEDTNWVVVDLKPAKKLKNPVTLKAIKEDPELEGISLVRLGRLSVHSITPQEFKHIVKMGS